MHSAQPETYFPVIDFPSSPCNHGWIRHRKRPNRPISGGKYRDLLQSVGGGPERKLKTPASTENRAHNRAWRGPNLRGRIHLSPARSAPLTTPKKKEGPRRNESRGMAPKMGGIKSPGLTLALYALGLTENPGMAGLSAQSRQSARRIARPACSSETNAGGRSPKSNKIEGCNSREGE